MERQVVATGRYFDDSFDDSMQIFDNLPSAADHLPPEDWLRRAAGLLKRLSWADVSRKAAD